MLRTSIRRLSSFLKPQLSYASTAMSSGFNDVEVNGVKVTDYREGEPVPPRKFDFEPQLGPRPNEGFFGLQNHSKDDVVFFKEVSIQPLL